MLWWVLHMQNKSFCSVVDESLLHSVYKVSLVLGVNWLLWMDCSTRSELGGRLVVKRFIRVHVYQCTASCIDLY